MDEQISRRLAGRLAPGEHRLTNRDLRDAYGLSRVTARARASIAAELERAGLEVLSDPAHEPLVVRKTVRELAPRRVEPPARPAAPAAKRRRPALVGGLALLFLLLVVGIAVAPEDEEPAAPRAEQPAEPVAQTVPVAAEEEPAPTLADAQDAVEAEEFVAAMAVARELDDDDRSRVRRMIRRSLARQVRAALRDGDHDRARRTLSRARRYGSGPELRSARSAYRAARERAVWRAERRRAAAAARRARAAERRAARRAAEEAARAAERAAEAEVTATPAPEAAPDTSGPSTVNWCGKRDGDGDGIYCEGL